MTEHTVSVAVPGRANTTVTTDHVPLVGLEYRTDDGSWVEMHTVYHDRDTGRISAIGIYSPREIEEE